MSTCLGNTIPVQNIKPQLLKCYIVNKPYFFSERGCATEEGFHLRGNSIDSGYGHADDAKVLLFLGTDGFKTSNLYPKLGTVTFEFEVQCEGPCHLSFYQVRFDDRQSKERTRDAN